MERSNMTTLCYIESEDSYLMMHRVKKKQDVSQDKWIGVGGHFEYGESPEECLLREVREETGLILTSYEFRGIVTFIADRHQPEYMCLYTARGFEGETGSCEEGNLEWVKKEQIWNLNLWEGDKIFFQLLDDREPFFSLKLHYENDRLIQASLNGNALELLEVLDSEGKETGRVQARFLMHRRGIAHRTAHVWIIRPNEKSGYDLLLQKRCQTKDSYPGCYDISSAGHVPAGAGCIPSALRELKEELGIDAQAGDLEYIGVHEVMEADVFYGKAFRNHEVSPVYLYRKAVPADSLVLQETEVEAVIWMDYEECRAAVRNKTIPHCIHESELDLIGRCLGLPDSPLIINRHNL